MKTRFVAQALLASTLLSGCWWDGGDSASPPVTATPTPDTAVPASAGATAQAYVSYAQTLPVTESSNEPLSLDLIAAAPTSESDEPVALN